MKEGRFARYRGKEYIAGKDKNGRIILRSTNITDVENGFEPCEPFLFKKCEEKIVCIKLVNRAEIEDFYSLRTRAKYAGFNFEVVEENKNKLSIVAMTGDYRDWLNLGMQCIDKGVYQKWIDKDEAEIEIVKEQL